MKYYIGRLVINNEANDHQFSEQVCIAAANEAAARDELDTYASQWGEVALGKDAAGFYRFRQDGASLKVIQFAISEVSPVTYDEMSKLLTPLGASKKVSLDLADQAEAVKTAARRIGDQLAKLDVKVPNSKLLQALSAALGATGWAQVKAKVSPKAPTTDIWLPKGNPYTGALRKATDVEFSARVDAVWLAEGDVALAAKLLRVDPEALMNSFVETADADTAYCGRHPDWLPEHSLSRDFGNKADIGRLFEIEVTHLMPGATQVVGKVDGREVMSFNNHIAGQWHMAGMTVPSGPFHIVRRIMACQEETLRRAMECLHSETETWYIPSN